MHVDCSKLANKGDLLALVCLLAIAALLAAVILLAVFVDSFAAGFCSATILWKWHPWVYAPLDRVLDTLWAGEACHNNETGNR